jgi:ATP-dependent DNA helicase, RecQ-like (EC 3.6.1.-)
MLSPAKSLDELKSTPELRRWESLRWNFQANGRNALEIPPFAWEILSRVIERKCGVEINHSGSSHSGKSEFPNHRIGGIMLENQLQKYFGFNSFKKGQKEVIDKIMKGQSATAIFPTGAGKSLCYQLPAMLLPGMTLVVSPLLSLMKDQIDFLLEHNISAARLDSTLDRRGTTLNS